MRAPRKLTVLASLDVAGYTRLVERDERGTLTELATIRRRILRPTLATHGGKVCVCDLEASVPVKQPTVSHHLAILRDAGLVNIREEGKQTFYTLNQENIVICCGQLMIKFAPETTTTEKLIHVINQ